MIFVATILAIQIIAAKFSGNCNCILAPASENGVAHQVAYVKSELGE